MEENIHVGINLNAQMAWRVESQYWLCSTRLNHSDGCVAGIQILVELNRSHG